MEGGEQTQQQAETASTDENAASDASPTTLQAGVSEADEHAIVPSSPDAAEEPHETATTAAAALPAFERDASSDYSATSSLYGGGSSLVGTAGGGTSIGDGPATSAAGLAPTLGGGTLSPPHTLVNSDGASMRVHTGSIRERNFNRRISAIHEDDSDVYSESRRSDSIVFGQTPLSARYQGPRRQSSRRRESEDEPEGAPRLLSESDCLSIVSGISEGGASTTRVRLATDRAYDALRIGAPPAFAGHLGFGYIQHQGGGHLHRAMSFATSSDPGLPSAGSFYDYYLDPNDYVPNSGSMRDSGDESSECGHRRRRRRDDDIVSLIRSDIAVYGSAVDDVKFPFLPDNFSEFSGSVVYSPSGALDHSERGLRDQGDMIYVQPMSPPPPEQSLEQSGGRPSNKKSRRKDRLIIRNGKSRDLPSSADSTGPSQMRGRAVRAPAAAAAPGPASRPSRHYRRQSASEAYPSTTTVTVVAVASTSAAPGIRPANSNSPAIRPNALMRFFKRITPKT
ncbi:hypothetical protein GGH91_004431 [Coemansia sp. RSA 2671]|uniref:Uncharacterized protein n=1 Tax=Coemansia linderi TaxID=2663919 RepID=A0ACC1KNY4_9FUNG|nr:hypothetical protein GGH91_004431 [Coemansia sp. RSA 2671]KAJ2792568.1 hypothetical protein GGI18_000304 [Coemansia linderi]